MTKPRRLIREVAKDIVASWRSPTNWAAKPYIEAMLQLDTINDMYGADSARSVVLYFLSNASMWRGETARNCKAELKAILGDK